MNNSSIAKRAIQAALILAFGSLAGVSWAQAEKVITTASRPDPGLRPPVAERRAVPLAPIEQAPSARRPSAQGLSATAPSIRAPSLVASACQGVAMGKEQARASGNVCAPAAGKSPTQLAQAAAPQKAALQTDAADMGQLNQTAKTAQEAAPDPRLANDGQTDPTIASRMAGSVPVALKAGSGGVEAIPTLSEWGVVLLALLLGLFGLRKTRKSSGNHWLGGMFTLVLGAALMATGTPASATTPDVITYIHTDVSGSPLAATNDTGTVVWKESYRAYGERWIQMPASGAQQQWFHGKEQDSTGLQYFGARYYDPVVGRFIGIDPVGFQEGNLHSFNRYAYGNNNPNRYADPNGMWAEDIVLALPGMYMGSHSLVDNLKQGNLGAAGIDAVGLMADGVALALPGVPGGAGLAIKAMREGVEAAVKGEAALSSRAARREAMRDAGIPTSQQPVSQSRNASGREYSYDVSAPGGGPQRMSVQQQTMDRSHPGQTHWEAGRVKTDPRTGAVRENNYGRPALTNDKSKVDY